MSSAVTRESDWRPANLQNVGKNIEESRAPGDFPALRRAAFVNFNTLGLPRPTSELWRFTNLEPISKAGLEISFSTKAAKVKAEDLRDARIEGLECYTAAFVNGRFDAALSALPSGQGITCVTLADWFEGKAENGILAANLAKHIPYDRGAFQSLNTAVTQDGIFLHVAANTKLDRPLHVIHLTEKGAKGTIVAPRLLAVVEQCGEASIIESFVSKTSGAYMNVAVAEIVAGESSNVKHYKIINEGDKGYHVGTSKIVTARAATTANMTFSFGGSIVRNDLEFVAEGSDCNSTLNGLTVIDETQLVDNHTIIDNQKPNCFSIERYKGIYADSSRGVFDGTIIVRQDAQKTNAIQSNQALLLSDSATINSQPQLKIWADDVKCTHGATVGQLDENALFYLRSRGISENIARQLLIHAFASDVLTDVKDDAIRAHLEALITSKLKEI